MTKVNKYEGWELEKRTLNEELWYQRGISVGQEKMFKIAKNIITGEKKTKEKMK